MSIALLLALLCFLTALEPIYYYFSVFEGQFYRLDLNLVVSGWKYWFVGMCIEAVCILLIGILLLLKKDRKVINIPLILWAIVSWVYFSINTAENGFNMATIFYPVAISLLLLINLGVLPEKKLWFLPGAVTLVRIIYSLYLTFSAGGSPNFSYVFLILLCAFLFLYPYALQKGSLYDKAAVSRKIPAPVQQTNHISSNAEELKKYYSLYKSGVLTEEEYQSKRKQILGE